MAKNKLSTQEKLIEIGKGLGGIFALLFAAMDARVRPYILEGVEFAGSLGIRGGRLVRQLVDRHLVAMFLRPLLIFSTVAVTIAYVLGIYWTGVIGVGFSALGAAGEWLGGIALVATLVPATLIFLVWRVRGLRDAGIRRLREQITVTELAPAATATGQLRAAIEGHVTQVNASLAMPGHSPIMIDTLTTTLNTLQVLDGEAARVERGLQAGDLEPTLVLINALDGRFNTALQGVAAHLATPAVQQDAAAQFAAAAFQAQLNTLRAALQAVRAQVEQAQPRIMPQLRLRVVSDFGRPGFAPHIAATLVLQWAVACAWFIALGVVLRSSHLSEIHVDHRWTSGFIMMATVLGFGAFSWLALAISIARAALKYGLRLILWAARLVAKPVVEIYDFEDEDDELTVARDLGLPIDQWSWSLGFVLSMPLGVYAGLMMLLVTGHSIEDLGLIAMDAFVLLLGYLFLVKMAGIRNEWIYRGVVISHFVWAVARFILWVRGTGADDITGWFAIENTGGRFDSFYGLSLAVTPTFVVVMIALAALTAYLSRKVSGTPSRLLIIAATVFGVAAGGMVLARTAFADSAPAADGASASSDGGDSDDNGLGDLIPRHTVNAGSHDGSPGNPCSLSDPSRACR